MLARREVACPPMDGRIDLYVSVDVETDGPIPGPYSLLSVGMSIAGTFDGRVYRAVNPSAETFYRELRPISPQFEREALAVNGLDRERLLAEGQAPESAMQEAHDWVANLAAGRRPVLVAYPVAFDWAFLYWYFVRFARSGSPFGYSSCLDIRTLYQARAHTVFDRSSKQHMPAELLPNRPHTHNALDDAVEQAELFSNVFAWSVAQAMPSFNSRL
jgi:DNA polymerase III epsilon subunit-like protein